MDAFDHILRTVGEAGEPRWKGLLVMMALALAICCWRFKRKGQLKFLIQAASMSGMMMAVIAYLLTDSDTVLIAVMTPPFALVLLSTIYDWSKPKNGNIRLWLIRLAAYTCVLAGVGTVSAFAFDIPNFAFACIAIAFVTGAALVLRVGILRIWHR